MPEEKDILKQCNKRRCRCKNGGAGRRSTPQEHTSTGNEGEKVQTNEEEIKTDKKSKDKNKKDIAIGEDETEKLKKRKNSKKYATSRQDGEPDDEMDLNKLRMDILAIKGKITAETNTKEHYETLKLEPPDKETVGECTTIANLWKKNTELEEEFLKLDFEQLDRLKDIAYMCTASAKATGRSGRAAPSARAAQVVCVPFKLPKLPAIKPGASLPDVVNVSELPESFWKYDSICPLKRAEEQPKPTARLVTTRNGRAETETEKIAKLCGALKAAEIKRICDSVQPAPAGT